MLACIGVEHVHHHTATIAVWSEAVGLGEDELVLRQALVIDGPDSTAFAFGLFREELMETHHRHESVTSIRAEFTWREPSYHLVLCFGTFFPTG